MIGLLAAEQTKLSSTRAPWWCAALALAFAVGLATVTAVWGGPGDLTVAASGFGLDLGGFVVLVIAALAVTGEYRFGTIRVGFLAVPNRVVALLAKTVVVAGYAGLLGLVGSFASWGVLRLADGTDATALATGADWRVVAGQGLVYAGYAVVALGVGLLVRQTAAALSILLVWAMGVELIVPIVDVLAQTRLGDWLPFANAGLFVAGADGASRFGGPWGSLAYFLAVGAVVLAAGIVAADRRDA